MRESAVHVEREEKPDEWKDRKEVALLDPVGAVGRIERGLEDDRQGDERPEDGEAQLRA
jgi:hypothetical protein